MLNLTQHFAAILLCTIVVCAASAPVALAGTLATSQARTACVLARRSGDWFDVLSVAPFSDTTYAQPQALAPCSDTEVRAARAYALLNMAMHDAAVATWDAKFAYYNPRPSQLDPTIKTLMGLPNFPSYVSGHSTYSASAAAVLSYLFPAQAASFTAMADEAAISRLYGGIHYRSDIEVGKALGTRVGGYAVSFARLDGAN